MLVRSTIIWHHLLLVAFLEGWILTPWIQSHTMELSALTILLAMLFGGAIGGILGLLAAIPIAACAKIVLDEYWHSRPTLVSVLPPRGALPKANRTY